MGNNVVFLKCLSSKDLAVCFGEAVISMNNQEATGTVLLTLWSPTCIICKSNDAYLFVSMYFKVTSLCIVTSSA